MPRVRKGAARTQARRRILRSARGYWGTKSRHKQQAKVALTRAGQNAYRDRRRRRREFRRLWITRITAACRMRGSRYSRFVNGLQRSGVLLNRKMLSQLAIEDPKAFDRLVEMAEANTTASHEKRPRVSADVAASPWSLGPQSLPPLVFVNPNYLKLRGAYLFPEIARRVDAYKAAHPETADRIISCGIGDVKAPLPAAVIEAMHAALDEMGQTETFRGYGPPLGYPFLREAIAKGDFGAHGLDVDAGEIFVSDGSKTDCGAILDILAPPGADAAGVNRIGITDPVYPVYVDTNVMAGLTGPARADGSYEGIRYLPCTADNGFVPEVPDERLDVVYLCYPNNPTGAMISRAGLEAWVEYALRHRTLILYDVAYQAYVRDPGVPRSIYEIEGARRCAMEFHSFSKNGGFTGVRCGYTVCPRELTGATGDGREAPLHDLWTRRWSTKSNSVGYVVQRGAEALYSEAGRKQVDDLVDGYLENARLLREGCRALGLTVHGGVNAPYVWVECPEGEDSWSTFDAILGQAHVVVTPGVGFGRCGEGYFRISAFNTRETVEEVVRRMARLPAAGTGA